MTGLSKGFKHGIAEDAYGVEAQPPLVLRSQQRQAAEGPKKTPNDESSEEPDKKRKPKAKAKAKGKAAAKAKAVAKSKTKAKAKAAAKEEQMTDEKSVADDVEMIPESTEEDEIDDDLLAEGSQAMKRPAAKAAAKAKGGKKSVPTAKAKANSKNGKQSVGQGEGQCWQAQAGPGFGAHHLRRQTLPRGRASQEQVPRNHEDVL